MKKWWKKRWKKDDEKAVGDVKAECEAEKPDGLDAEKVDEVKDSKLDGEVPGEVGETKKTYKRKVHTPEELTEMWKLKVSGLHVFFNTGAMKLYRYIYISTGIVFMQ